MQFDITELNRLIEEDLKERRAEKRLEMEIEELEKDLECRSKELEALRKQQQVRGIETGAMKYFQEYLTHCEQTMALPKKVFATVEGAEHEQDRT